MDEDILNYNRDTHELVSCPKCDGTKKHQFKIKEEKKDKTKIFQYKKEKEQKDDFVYLGICDFCSGRGVSVVYREDLLERFRHRLVPGTTNNINRDDIISLLDPEKEKGKFCRLCNLILMKELGEICNDCPFCLACNWTGKEQKNNRLRIGCTHSIFQKYGIQPINSPLGRADLIYHLDNPGLQWIYPRFPNFDMDWKPRKKSWKWSLHHWVEWWNDTLLTLVLFPGEHARFDNFDKSIAIPAGTFRKE